MNSRYHFNEWLELVRKFRSSRSASSPNCLQSLLASSQTLNSDTNEFRSTDQVSDTLWERLGKAAMLDIESSSLSWNMLSSVHHTEHNTSTEHCEDEMNRALEVTVNSGGVIFFALFKQPGGADSSTKEAAAVVKISSSRMATQSERLGYEFAKLLGVRTPQARVIHSFTPEWLQIKEAAERVRDMANSNGDEVGEVTCSELLEALELSRCLFLMNYVHGYPLLESSNAFEPSEVAEKTAASLGRILMLDLVIRNEDRLPCRELRWRGNPANLLLADKAASTNTYALEETFNVELKQYKPRANKPLQKERRAVSVDSKLNQNSALEEQGSDLSDVVESPKSSDTSLLSEASYESASDIHIVAIDSGVPRRPPAGKRANDQAMYPKLVELLLNSPDYSSNLLYNITCGRLGSSYKETNQIVVSQLKARNHAVQEFRGGFRGALRDLQGFHIFLLTLHQKLENLLRLFMNIINRSNPGDYDKEELAAPDSPTSAVGVSAICPFSSNKERVSNDITTDMTDPDSQKTPIRSSATGHREHLDFSSPICREGWHGKFYRGSGEPLRCLRLTSKLRDFQRYAKVDVELNKELEQWNEILKSEAVVLCQENNFNTGFFEGSDNNIVIDAYELKVPILKL
uniref:Actin-fragmin kinase catalytic domain-containing protein n=1 Tax=Kalanchoe fedtschenkoi TaxID=63787 RepID=A0A7N0UZ64_KALFE